MSRKVVYEDYRVEVRPLEFIPAAWSHLDEHKQQLQQLHGLLNQICRHIDGVVCRATSTAKAVCSFCGRPWTEGQDDPHNGGCCDQDAANMPEEIFASQQADSEGQG
jgi:hypothetical protein